MKQTLRIVGVVAATLALAAQEGVSQTELAFDLTEVEAGVGWILSNREASTWREGNQAGVVLDARPGYGMAWIDGLDFDEGTIEVSLRGSDTPGRSFVGIAFHGVDHDTFEGVYVRPFNFRADNPTSRSHALQYVSHPDHTWPVLRRESPDAYEAALDPAPDPDHFVRLRIVLEGAQVSVFIDESTTPALEVTGLSGRTGGLVGLWVGNNSDGTFTDLVLKPRR